MSKVFVDTNILVYSIDAHDPHRRERSRQALRDIIKDNSGVISTQVLQEFYVVVTKKLGVEPIIAKGMIHGFESFEIVVIDLALIKDAIDCSVLNKISFWDALIVAGAESAKCETIWTEDLGSGQTINGIQIVNPLKNEPFPK